MFDFLSRQSRARRSSSRFYALVLLAQGLTAVATGIAVGYLLMFPVVYVAATIDAAAADAANSSHRSAFRSNVNESYSRYSWRRRNTQEVLKRFVHAFEEPSTPDTRCVDPAIVFWYTSLFGISVCSLGILAATFYERRRIVHDGGWAIGLALGGRHLNKPRAGDERKLVNVVEEMAIAFGTTPPTVVVLDHEPGINVFAAGLDADSSILCVTAGAIKHLPREELQGVIAHEFSHLTQGDTRLGTRLTAILYGLNSVRLFAEWVFRVGHETSESREKGACWGYVWMLVGIVIWPFGLAGAFAAAMLTRAITRSREALADAEAVQKTRNPAAMANALRRIIGHPQRGQLLHPQTTIVAPMLFVDYHNKPCWYASHPPIESRLFALDPLGDATPIYSESVTKRRREDHDPKTAAAMELLFGDFTANDGALETSTPSLPPSVSDPIGTPSIGSDVSGGDAAVATLVQPVAVVSSLIRPETFAISIPMLIGLEPTQSTSQCDSAWFAAICDADIATRAEWLTQLCSEAEMMSPKEREKLRLAAEQCRGQLDDRDWTRHASLWMLTRATEPSQAQDEPAFVAPPEVAGYSRIILSVLSVCDGDDGMADYEFMRGWSQLRFADTARVPEAELSWCEFEHAVQTMSQAAPHHVESLLVAIANVVSGDGRVSTAESAVIAMVRTALEP
ncbi:Peptidase M48, Ste24p [Rhodopirellula maiorica SM1]|uniref:Peptidase M48, Ste24p n=1 Tax=Rhodopirellula maiorica SM1 TaxID=1265738 RepID=M5S421_9BACT|nr:M48 family metalloprotease [Rhodopirellula maiorica]EMI22382.1 Peptidase M48, Ste24p [Rhodopirellula maiorica SM1]